MSRNAHRGQHITVLLKEPKGPDFRVTVPARLVPKAVERNKIKRWCRELWRKSKFKEVKGVVFDVKTTKTSFKNLQKDVIEAERTLLS